MDLIARGHVGALAGFGGQEELLAVAAHPRPDPQLGFAIAGGGVDVVDAVLKQQLQRAVGVILRDIAERRRAKDRACASVAGAAEGERGNHWFPPFIHCILHIENCSTFQYAICNMQYAITYHRYWLGPKFAS